MAARHHSGAGAPVVVEPAGLVPLPPTPLIGRERELATAQRLLSDRRGAAAHAHRSGGSGKTRLALEVAGGMAESFAHGACFVDLAPIREPALVVSSVAGALGVRDDGRQPLLERLLAALHDRELLLVLDNFEHLLPAAPVRGRSARALSRG